MEMLDLLEKMMKFAGEKVGQKPGEQWKGTDKAPPGKKLVGDSILKDLSKGKTPKSKEQELSEEFQAFLEAEFKDTVDKRPGRASDRPSRGHKPLPRYKTVKADESAMSEKDIELQDYRSMSHKEFQNAYKMTKTEWINKNKALIIRNPSIKKALGLEEDSYYGPVEARWMVVLSDDEGQHIKNFHDTYPSLSAAKKKFKNTMYATDFSWKPIKKKVTDEGIDTFNRAGFNPIRDERDYLDKRSTAWNLLNAKNTDSQTKAEAKQRILDLDKQARAKGYVQAESRGHKIVATKLKDIERSKTFHVPSAEERRELQQRMKDFEAQLKATKSKKQVKEYGANQPTGTAGQTSITDPNAGNSAEAKDIAQATSAIKSATQSTVPAPMIAKGIEAASKGQPVGQQDMKAIQPIMKDIYTAMQDPKIAQGAFKNLAQQANLAQTSKKKS